MTYGDNSSTVIDELTKRLRANQIGYEDAYQAAIEAADLIERQAAEILNIRSRADRQASTIASLYQAKASLEREVSRLARQPAAIDKQAVAVVRDNPDDYGTIIEPIGDAVLPVGTELYAAPLANEANKPAPLVEQDEEAADEYLRVTAQKLSDMGYLWQAENLRRAVGFPVADSKPAAPSAEVVMEARRFRWIAHDHDHPEDRDAVRRITENMSVKSYSALCRDIDAAIADSIRRENGCAKGARK